MTRFNSNAACCSIPPVQAFYQPQGTFRAYGDFKKVYITGPEKTDKALVCVFDIFGFWPQTQQGADILAETLNAKVLMPDFFEPHNAFSQDDYPPNTPEKKVRLQEFFQNVARVDVAVTNVNKLGLLMKAEGYKHIGLYGFCWVYHKAGKVAILSGSEKVYDAVASVHPA
ncbi:hypothetical protein Clacol_008174 [Clathrus columnatus]|uniref:Dienelactone hydrolase domain-containing protein n=1 Tax=Clathrus columnatus TaxID=1419009 RepID=A0AAV5AJS2_9AGAM|nr:hypothetical protein Clacol_008174 [Clathrus columnatus]